MRENKSNIKRIAVLLLAVMLLIGCTIGGTLAWLSAQADKVENTFTIGNITIDLKEHELKTDGTLDLTKEVDKNSYKIVPGGKQPKDPFVTVKAGSENCYVYVLVTNNLAIDGTTVATLNIDIDTDDTDTDTATWEVVGSASGNKTLYRYNAVVEASAIDQPLQVFTEVAYANSITEADFEKLTDKTIVIEAFAHQSDNTTQAIVDATAKAHFGIT